MSLYLEWSVIFNLCHMLYNHNSVFGLVVFYYTNNWKILSKISTKQFYVNAKKNVNLFYSLK